MKLTHHAFVLIVSLMMLTTGIISLPFQAQAVAGAGEDDLKEQAPFVIEGNGDLEGKASANGWPGDGTPARPYLIEGLSIQCDANATSISIRNTTLSFRVSNCVITATGQVNDGTIYRGVGVSLTNVANGTLSGLSINGFERGIDVDSSRDLRIENCSVSAPRDYGINAQHSQRMVIENNTLRGGIGPGIRIGHSERSMIQYNNASFTGYCGIDLREDNHDFTIRWNMVSSNEYGGTNQLSNGLNLGGTGHLIYGNVLVGASSFSPPAGTEQASGNTWVGPDGYGNYYGINYDSSTLTHSSFLGEPIYPLVDYGHDGLSDASYHVRNYGGESDESNVDTRPLFSPTVPPRDLKATVSAGIVTLTWASPRFTTSPAGHYVVTRQSNESTVEMIATERTVTDSINDLEDWDSISYTVRWVGKFLSSGPSNSVSVQNPDRPILEIISSLDGSMVTLFNLTRMYYTSMDPRSVTVAWAGYDSDSESMSYSVRLDDGAWLDNGNSQTWTFTNLTEGTHTVTVRATDNDGNQVETSKTFEVYRYIEMSLDCRPYVDGNETRLRLYGRAWDAATGVGMTGLGIAVAYSVDRGASWAFGNVTSGPDGRFDYLIDLETKVIHGLMLTTQIIDRNGQLHYFIEESSYAAVIPDGHDHVLVAYSERTISDFSFSSRMIRFDVSSGGDGQDATAVLVPKAVCKNSGDISVTLDGVRLDSSVSEDGDYWLLIVPHNESAHEMVVQFGSSGLGLVSPGDLPLVAGLLGTAALAGVTFLVWRSRRGREHQ